MLIPGRKLMTMVSSKLLHASTHKLINAHQRSQPPAAIDIVLKANGKRPKASWTPQLSSTEPDARRH
jgi:hypothetical protein